MVRASLSPTELGRNAFPDKTPKRNDPIPCPFTIVRDKDEKAPFSFHGIISRNGNNSRPIVVGPQKVRKLQTADYSIEGWYRGKFYDLSNPATSDFVVVVERKSLSDLFGSLAGKDGERLKRFQAEHERMQQINAFGGLACVVIEGAWEDIQDDTPDHGAHPNAVEGFDISWPFRYGVQWHWCNTRNGAEKKTYWILDYAWRLFKHQVDEKLKAQAGVTK